MITRLSNDHRAHTNRTDSLRWNNRKKKSFYVTAPRSLRSVTDVHDPSGFRRIRAVQSAQVSSARSVLTLGWWLGRRFHRTRAVRRAGRTASGANSKRTNRKHFVRYGTIRIRTEMLPNVRPSRRYRSVTHRRPFWATTTADLAIRFHAETYTTASRCVVSPLFEETQKYRFTGNNRTETKYYRQVDVPKKILIKNRY